MKRVAVVILSLHLLSGLLLAQEVQKPAQSVADELHDDRSWKLTGISETVATYRHNNAEDSSSDHNSTFRQELGINIQGKVGDGTSGIKIRGRSGNDKRISSQHAELLYIRSFYNDTQFDIQAGDVAQTYNPLVYSGTLKGATLTYTSQREQNRFIRYSLIGGIQTSSWYETFEHQKNFRDTIAGDMHYQHAMAQSIAVTLSAAKNHYDSQQSSLDNNISEALTAGVRWNWRFSRYIKSKGELALTSINNNTRENRYAGRITLYTKPTKSINCNFKYERYDTGYNSIVGSSMQDTQRFENTSSWSISRQLRSRISLKSSHDNLDGQLGETRRTNSALLSFNYRPNFLKRGDMGLRMQQLTRKGRGDDTTQVNLGLDFSERLKNGWRYAASYDYTRLDNSDDTNQSNHLQTLRAKVGWKTQYNEDNNFRASIKIDISFYDEHREDQKRFGGTLDGGWDYGENFMLDLLVTSKNTDRDLNEDTSYQLYQLIAQYKPFGDRSQVIKLNLQRRERDGAGNTSKARLSYAFTF